MLPRLTLFACVAYLTAGTALSQGLFERFPEGHPLASPAGGLSPDAPLPAAAEATLAERAVAQHEVRVLNLLTGPYWFARTRPLAEAFATDETLAVNLPDGDVAIELRQTYREQVGDVLAVQGGADSEGVPVGTFGLYESPRGLAGFVHVGSTVYTVVVAGNGASFFYENLASPRARSSATSGLSGSRPMSGGTACGTCDVANAGGVPAATAQPVGTPAAAPAADDACVVDLVVALDLSAQEVSDAEVEAAVAIAQTNEALANSLVGNLRYRLAAAVNLEDVRVSDDDGSPLRTLGADDEIAALYDTYAADQVMVVGATGPAAGQDPAARFVFGTSELRSVPENRDLTFVTTDSGPYQVMAHELGHNHGCTHGDNTQPPPDALRIEPYARPSSVDSAFYDGTIMRAGNNPSQGPSDLHYFSNPDIVVGGFPIGLEGRANHARVMRETACFIAGFSESRALPVDYAATLTAVVDGPAVRLAWASATEVDCAQYTVERSLDGAAWQAVSTEPCAGEPHAYATRDARPPRRASVYYRLRQSDLDGSSHYGDAVVVDARATTTREAVPTARVGPETLLLNNFAPDAALSLLAPDGRVVRAFAPGTREASVSDLRRGLYLVHYRGSGGSGVVKVVW